MMYDSMYIVSKCCTFYWLQFTDAYFTTQGEDPAAPYMEPSGAYSELTPKDEDYEQLGLITERNLVDFARQIAAGMVRLGSCCSVVCLIPTQCY